MLNTYESRPPARQVNRQEDRPLTPLDLLWLFFILSSLQPALQQRILTVQRARALRTLESASGRG